jgi:8-oxo-dGTP diphosphatase
MSDHGIVVSGLAVDNMGRILMGKRKLTQSRPGMWETPGGKVEHGEEPAAALAREWREELRLDIRVGKMIAATPVFHVESKFAVGLFAVEIIGNQMPELVDHDEIGWFVHTWAVVRMACTPAFYWHYPAIGEHIAGLKR